MNDNYMVSLIKEYFCLNMQAFNDCAHLIFEHPANSLFNDLENISKLAEKAKN